MTRWTAGDLDRIGAAEELQIASVRSDGSLRPYVPIWVVRVGDDLYVRSYRGVEGAWFRAVMRQRKARVRVAGIESDVDAEQAVAADQHAIDEAYRTKYASFAGTYVDPMVSPAAIATTLRLLPVNVS